jgi:hypothetical protein
MEYVQSLFGRVRLYPNLWGDIVRRAKREAPGSGGASPY